MIGKNGEIQQKATENINVCKSVGEKEFSKHIYCNKI